MGDVEQVPGQPDPGAQLAALVPMVRTLDIVTVEATPQRAVQRLPDAPPWRNHLGGPHAGAMFTLGESASGVLVLANFGDLLDRVTPLPRRASIEYLAVAMGDISATATLDPALAAAARAAVDAPDGRPAFTVEVELADPERVTGRMSVDWTLFVRR